MTQLDVTASAAADPDGAPSVSALEAVGDLRNIEECAIFFGSTPPTVRQWIAKGCPVVERGGHGVGYKLSMTAVHDWRQAEARRIREEAEDRARQVAEADQQLKLEMLGDALPEPEMTGPITPKMRADALAAEVSRAKLAEMRGDLVRADDLQLALSRAFALLAGGLRSLPDQLGRELGLSEETVVGLIAGINRGLGDLADALEKMEAGGDAGLLDEDDAVADETTL